MLEALAPVLAPGLALLLATAPTIQEAAPAAGDAVITVATVGSESITRDDLLAEIDRLVPRTMFHAKVSPELRRDLADQALEELVERSLIYQDAVARGLTATEEELRSEFDDTLSKSGPQYQGLSTREKASLMEPYRDLVTRRVLLDKNEARLLAAVPAVDEASMRRTYAEERGNLLTPPEARFRHIFKRLDPSATAAQAELAQRVVEGLRARIVAGESFEELARTHSDDIYAEQGGDTGFVTRGAFLTGHVDDVAFGLADGDLSPVIASIHGYHLIERLESRTQSPLSFEEARQLIADALQERSRVESRASWLGGLRQSLGVEILVDPMQVVPQEDGGTGKAPGSTHHGF